LRSTGQPIDENAVSRKLGHDRQLDPRRSLGAVVQNLVGDCDPGRGLVAGVEVAIPAGEGPTLLTRTPYDKNDWAEVSVLDPIDLWSTSKVSSPGTGFASAERASFIELPVIL
jgi:hypothetical protein